MYRLFILLFLLTGIANATTVTVDFESVPLSSDVGNYTALTTQGMHFQGIDSGSYNNGLIVYDDNYTFYPVPDPIDDRGLVLRSTGAFGSYEEPRVTITAENGSDFDFISFVSGTNDEFRIRGYDDQGNQVVAAASTNYYGPDFLLTSIDLGGGLSRYILDDDWLGLASVRLDGLANPNPASPYGVVLDNVEASVVPVPAAVWLFGSALAGLGWMRRRQAT